MSQGVTLGGSRAEDGPSLVPPARSLGVLLVPTASVLSKLPRRQGWPHPNTHSQMRVAFNRKKIIKTWAEDLNGHFSNNDVHVANRYTNITNHQGNANQSLEELSPHTCLNGHHRKDDRCWRGCGGKGPWGAVGGNADWESALGNSMEGPQKLEAPYAPAISHLGMKSPSQRDVQHSLLAKLNVRRQTNKENVEYSQWNLIPLQNQNKTAVCDMNEAGGFAAP